MAANDNQPVAATRVTAAVAAVSSAALPKGYQLMDEYEIDTVLGEGGFGLTYLAHDVNLNLKVAVKEYFPRSVATRGADQLVEVRASTDNLNDGQYYWGLERFLDEARALATFRHPNIVRVLRYFRANCTAYIVMEYESGDPLKRWVPRQAPFGRKAVLSIIYPLLDGLEVVHKTNFLHRDIKPDNIYVRADGTPVLLDFGAARRVIPNQDMTSIVTPGFAPFEQYHSEGNQGPWTDLYSLGAVMYWMTTGKKPSESASRVMADTMPAAVSLGDASIFGPELLQAIDWALSPHEARRPQDVAQFRAALQAAEAANQQLTYDTQHERTGLPAAAYAGINPGSGHTPGVGQSSSDRKNVLCTILFADLVGYSTRSVDDQVVIKNLFNELVGKAVKAVDSTSRIAIDTGDGAAICFMGDPEEALQSALLLRDLLAARQLKLAARIGLHMGPVRIVTDINQRSNVLGDGINVAQRVMDFAKGNQVLVSRAYYDVISRITDNWGGMFDYLGPRVDKHGRQHEVYAVVDQQATARAPGPVLARPVSIDDSLTVPVKSIEQGDPAGLAALEAELARHIGPLARVLVNKAKAVAPDLHALREALAVSIPDLKVRQLFIIGTSGNSGTHSQNTSQKMGPANSRPGIGSSISNLLSRVALPTSTSVARSHSQPGNPKVASQHLHPTVPGQPHHTETQRALDLSAEELTLVEQALSRSIGPLAKMLVRKESQRHLLYGPFVQALAGHIDQPNERTEFAAAVKRALPNR